ncbi:zinc-binding dehydrogenase [Georgenia sp. 311]|uniref:zinc-binding dehydrogenase n=1 Tax=Georgenia sp. 311 TaxID=2585134 RepID=UPI001111EB09|nr:zinc-binding dehydrogenase [Georgenia sp. 311]TNC16821.1 zinc-binding dehydrogenase [Georgenia sp. 311]
MLAAYAARQDADHPLEGLVVGEITDPGPPEPGWVPVRVRAAALNHHDLWSLRGVGLPADRLPMVLGCDAAGVDDQGRDVVVHAVVASPGWRGDETLDPARTLLSEKYPGTLAETVWVPPGNVVPKPPELTWAEAACLPTAYLTAYRLLFHAADLRPGRRVLVQGAGGGVSTAAVVLGRAAGLEVWVCGRDEARNQRALELGAHAVFPSGARLPAQVDAVLETVGEATWAHSLRAVRPGGTIAVAGATSGAMPPADLGRVFFRSVQVAGSTMGTVEELSRLVAFLVASGARPLVDEVLPFADAARAFRRLLDGDVFGKLVLELPEA